MGRTEQDGMRFHHSIESLQLVYFWHFPFNGFRVRLTVGNWNHRERGIVVIGLHMERFTLFSDLKEAEQVNYVN